MRETDNLPPHLKAGDKVILFDGVCKLCSAWTHFIIRYDQAQIFKLCSVQSPVGQALLQHFGYPTDVYDTMLYVDGKRSYDKGDAFLAIIGQFNYPWKLLAVFKLVPRFLRNWLYLQVSRNRYKWFGQSQQCLMPSPAHQARFLDA